jgi:hypothetical protein
MSIQGSKPMIGFPDADPPCAGGAINNWGAEKKYVVILKNYRSFTIALILRVVILGMQLVTTVTLLS